jgi:murein DD-endopeptidase MepM/ murein hydrolase activator NlpD
MKINNRIQIWALSLLAISVLFIAGFFGAKTLLAISQGPMSQPTKPQMGDTIQEPTYLTPEEEFPYQFPKNSTFFSVLRSEGVTGSEIQKIVDAAKPYYNLAKIQPGIRYQLKYDDSPDPQLIGIRFRFSGLESLSVKRTDESWEAEKTVEAVEIRNATFFGEVKTSLWESARQANMDSVLISELSEIFAWQVDFSREVRVGDRWRLSVEQKYVRGQPAGWGSILSAEYQNSGESFIAVLHRVEGEDLGYFTPEGESLRRMFLKSPIQFGRITSGFSKKRFHPILQVNRPHLGVDYAAPTGTPVRAVGEGVIDFSGWSGGGGNVIKIRHNSIYQTAYKHLSGYAKGIRRGTKVKQGQVIGYVGSTGLSTAPHLHFEFYQSGRFVDPVGKKFPSADPVPSQMLADFKISANERLQLLPSWETVEVALKRAMATDSVTETNKEAL